MVTMQRGRFIQPALALLAALAAVLCVAANPLTASPASAPHRTEGGTAQLRAALDAASRGYLEAKTALDQSKLRQAELAKRITEVEARLKSLDADAGDIAVAAYRTGGLASVSALIASGSPDLFLDRVTALNIVATRNDRQLRELNQLRKQLADDTTAVNNEIVNQQRQVDQMATRKQEAERALTAAGGGGAVAGPGGGKATATPAPRRADGSWPSESCSVDDPTTSGCLTPRTLHAMRQAKAAGFTRYVACFRTGDDGEHPKGRACDFAAATSSFGGIAAGAERTYGNNLAAYFIANADPLAVLYVIWFRQIWLPSSGWRAYSGGNGDPSSDHTNHVHLSVV
jgi:hypothetical protein